MTARLPAPLRAFLLFLALALASVAADEQAVAWLAGVVWGGR